MRLLKEAYFGAMKKSENMTVLRIGEKGKSLKEVREEQVTSNQNGKWASLRDDVRDRYEIIYIVDDINHSAYCIIENSFPNDSRVPDLPSPSSPYLFSLLK